MLILALDTTGGSAGAALWQDGHLLIETILQRGLTHSETLMPLINDLYCQVDRDPASTRGLACTTGPGSFTGIRIGISTVLGMAYSLNCPVIGYSTLAVLARPWRWQKDALIIPSLDARNQRVYAGVWSGQDLIIEENNWAAAELSAELIRVLAEETDRPLILCGSGQDVLSGQLPASLAVRQMSDEQGLPRPSVIAQWAEEDMTDEMCQTPQATWPLLQPRYLGRSQAERRRDQRAME
ncbi:MAG: tRNA (adenosine(37)-N6)-threonylcarbamoyltransferase complex dimerization subunit type 1 TsaB [Clostridia bacterium]|nr:tRNA (adenosine(37)-N6)-threonylcarbamoyltransferase complex dimerization subunit type 1 TsaB [Clostridia bacterium]